ncbi:fusl [Trypoxylus dichotomus]
MRGSTAGITTTLKGGSSTHYLFLCILDSVFSGVVVAPAVVGYWRSIWALMTIYAYPDDSVKSGVISTAIGVGGHLIFVLLQDFLIKHLHPDKKRIFYYVCSRIYTTCFGFVCVNGWRGPWLLLDYYTNSDLTVLASLAGISIIVLAFLRTLRNVSAPPFALATDHVKNYFAVPTMFKIKMTEKTTLYVLDCIFSVLVVGTLVVFVWRGAWVLLDIFLFPDHESLSAWSSLVIGYVIVALAFMLQPGMRWICDRLTGAVRLLAADLFLIFSLCGTVNLWRGVWMLLNIYFLPDQMELSCWITHWVCLILLILLGCSNSLLVRGVYIDAEEPAGKCVIFPCYYLRLIFQQERAKKIAKHLQLDTMSKRKQDGVENYVATANHITAITQLSITETKNHVV